jgi:hypothetical protein
MGKLYRMNFEEKNLYINLAGKHEEERPLGIRKSTWEISRPIGIGPEEI